MTYIVYGRPGCAPCAQAKELLTSKGKEHQYINIMDMIPVELDDFKEKHRSVPQVYLGDEYIGGLQDLTLHLVNLNKP
jgi:glutaredoxin